MVQTEFTVKSSDLHFRLAKMNAIEVLALQTQVQFTNVTVATNLFNAILERIEVQCGEVWLPVKMKDKNVFAPDTLENDLALTNELVVYFMNEFLKPVFQKSKE